MSAIVFVNRYFHPDHSATSQLLSDLAFELARAGHHVRVLACRQRYDDASAQLPMQETINGVQVFRVWTSRFGRQHLFGRAIDYATFYLSAAACLLRRLRRGDSVIAMTDPPLISVPVALVCRLRGARLINWLQDLFPEVACTLGLTAIRKIAWPLRWLRNGSLRAAHLNIVIGERMAQRLRAQGVGAERITIIHNWSDGRHIVPVEPSDNRLRTQWGLSGRFVVGYSGNMGRAHEFDTVLGAAQRLAGDERIVFLFIGAGARRAWLERECERRGLRNVVFQPYQPQALLAQSLSVPDVHVVSLYPGLEGLIVPSKFYGIAAAGRAVMYVGDENGEIPRLLQDGECGYTVAPGDVDTLVSRLRRFSSDPPQTVRLGANARNLFDACFDRAIAMRAWNDVVTASAGVALPASAARDPAWEITK